MFCASGLNVERVLLPDSLSKCIRKHFSLHPIADVVMDRDPSGGLAWRGSLWSIPFVWLQGTPLVVPSAEPVAAPAVFESLPTGTAETRRSGRELAEQTV